MPARFKDLCLNTNTPQESADFWSATLDLRIEPRDDTFVLRGTRDEETVWLNLVPEPKRAKSRVHLDVNVRSVEELVERGATVVDRSQPWTYCRAPDGVELDAFVRTEDELAGRRPLYELSVDCGDPERVCRWWAEAFGVSVERDPVQPWWWLGERERAGLGFGMVFAAVPEPKVWPNWIHWDVVGDTATFVAAGATLLRARDHAIGWDVLADPEGNEFCVFAG